MIVKINPPLFIGRQLLKPLKMDFERIKSVEHVGVSNLLENPFLAYIFSNLRLFGEHKYITCKVKVQDLKEGDFTCIPGWHTDTTTDLFRVEKPEVHHLFVSSDFALTEFISTQMTIDIESTTPLKQQVEQIERQSYETFQIPECCWVTYGRFNFHRGVQAKKSGKRLLVRIDETDIISPKRK